MTTTDLRATLERLREQKYPSIDANLVNEIITAQADFMENNAEAYKRILQCVESFLREEVGDNNA